MGCGGGRSWLCDGSLGARAAECRLQTTKIRQLVVVLARSRPIQRRTSTRYNTHIRLDSLGLDRDILALDSFRIIRNPALGMNSNPFLALAHASVSRRIELACLHEMEPAGPGSYRRELAVLV